MSNTKLEDYRAGRQDLPTHMLRWHLYGAGLENLGREGLPEQVPVPSYGADELLVRQDACGLCFSDTKVIGLGHNHPRMTGRDLATDPVTLGHEVSCTVVGVGEKLADKFHIGDRFTVQADVFYRGKSMAYGYAISGGLAEYSVSRSSTVMRAATCCRYARIPATSSRRSPSRGPAWSRHTRRSIAPPLSRMASCSSWRRRMARLAISIGARR